MCVNINIHISQFQIDIFTEVFFSTETGTAQITSPKIIGTLLFFFYFLVVVVVNWTHVLFILQQQQKNMFGFGIDLLPFI